MNTYILYHNFDNLSMPDFIKQMAGEYQAKTGIQPVECLINPVHSLEGTIDGIKIVQDDKTQPSEIMLR